MPPLSEARRGLMFVIASPSGAGKSTLSRLLLKEERNIGLSVSVTTRARRPSEVDGVHYHFVSRERYDQMVSRNELLEHAEVHGNGYGTPREPVEAMLASGRDVLFDIDWQGTLQLYDKMRAEIASVFILPPSISELRNRLERRAEDSRETIERRLQNARIEMSHWQEYDYVLVNSDIDRTFRDLRAILAAERLKRERQVTLGPLVLALCADIKE
jgi:guanylate kinase